MPIVLNGSGTVTGVSVGGLPDGIVDADMLAANAVTAGKLASGVGGKILQVQQTLKQDVFSMSGSSTYTAVTGLSVSITPSSATNKILIFGTIYSSSPTDDYATVFALYKDGSAVAAAHGTGSGTRYGAAMKLRADGGGNAKHLHHEFLDTAGGTSAITYQYYMAAETTGYVGRTGDDSNSWYQARCPSIITAMEVAA
jgi:hypothetical protein